MLGRTNPNLLGALKPTAEMAAAFRLRLVTASGAGNGERAIGRRQPRGRVVDHPGRRQQEQLPTGPAVPRLRGRDPETDTAARDATSPRIRNENRPSSARWRSSKRQRRRRGRNDRDEDFRDTTCGARRPATWRRPAWRASWISKVLNHVEMAVTAVYDRHSYNPEKKSRSTPGRDAQGHHRSEVERRGVERFRGGQALENTSPIPRMRTDACTSPSKLTNRRPRAASSEGRSTELETARRKTHAQKSDGRRSKKIDSTNTRRGRRRSRDRQENAEKFLEQVAASVQAARAPARAGRAGRDPVARDGEEHHPVSRPRDESVRVRTSRRPSRRKNVIYVAGRIQPYAS